MDSMRAFIAIALPPETVTALGLIQRAWQASAAAAARAVKWVQPASIHLTLKFLGETHTSMAPALGLAIEQAARGRGAPTLRLAQTGCFPNTRLPRVLWVGLGGDVALLAGLQAAIEQHVSPLGFPSEQRPFSPHLTLGRVREEAAPEARQALGSAASGLNVPQTAFLAASVSLMRSDLRRDGAVYTQLAKADLAAGQ